MNFDVILYFCFVHSSHIHKYLNLNKRLNQKCKSLLILSNEKWGVSDNLLNNFKDEDKQNVLHLNNADALSFLSKANYKVGIFSGNGRKGNIGNSDVSIAKSKGVKTIQISEMNIDFYYAGADFVGLISSQFENSTTLCSDLQKMEDKRKFYLNCFLWDKVEDCLPYHLSKEDFCNKYNLDIKKPIFMWGPDSIQCQHENAQRAYDKACSIDNVIVKLHPNEIRRHKAERVNFGWSNNLYSKKETVVLDSLDAHWAFKYIDCLIGYQSTLSLETPFFRKPTLFMGFNDEKNLLFNAPPDVAYRRNFPWVGNHCEIDQLEEFIENKKYQVPDSEYDDYLNKWLDYPDKKSYELIIDKTLEYLG